jgi:cation:H+ antiporter
MDGGSVFGDITLIVLGLVVIAYVGTRLVRVLNSLSIHAKMPKFVLAFIVMGLGTSLPDLFVAFFGATSGQMPLVLGTVIGANIIILTLIIGAVTFIKDGIKVREKTVLENFGWLFFVIVIPFFLLLDGRLVWYEGVILVVVYLMYVYTIAEQEHMHLFGHRSVQTELTLGEEAPRLAYYKKHEFLVHSARAIAFLGLLLLASKFVVDKAVALSVAFNIPSFFIGITVVALGATLPELAMDLSALRAKQEEIIWGDLIGSFVVELSLVLGVAALFGSFAHPVQVPFLQTAVGYAFMAICFVLVYFFTATRKELTKSQGLALMLLYVVFISLQIDFALLGGSLGLFGGAAGAAGG